MGTPVDIKEPILIVGIGGAGSKLAKNASKLLACEYLLISNDKKDFDENSSTILINQSSWINPSSYKLRSFAQQHSQRINSSLDNYNTIIIISNLAGRAGTAIAPLVCNIAKSLGKTIITFAIMPFRFEKDRLFQSAVSLKRIRNSSSATIVIDNDALLENNPELSVKECHKISNGAILEIISSISSININSELNVLCTGKENLPTAESSLKETIGMLYQNTDPENVTKAMVYIIGGQDVPIGTLDLLVSAIQKMFRDDTNKTQVSMAVTNSKSLKIHLVASVTGISRFDRYDPLGIIPEKNVIDWEQPDSHPDIEMLIQNIE